MQLFYTTHIVDDYAWLKGQEHHHACHVLRKKNGDEITFTNGKGNLYSGIMLETTREHVKIKISSCITEDPRQYRITLAIAPPKQMARFEWCAEKLTEIGVDAIIPILCKRSERKHIQTKRIEKILISAMKQSLKASYPEITELTPISTCLENLSKDIECKFLAHLDESVMAIEKHYVPGKDVIIVIGPEGDFTEQEIQFAKHHGFIPVTLSGYRLRTETAALAACQSIHVLNRST